MPHHIYKFPYITFVYKINRYFIYLFYLYKLCYVIYILIYSKITIATTLASTRAQKLEYCEIDIPSEAVG